MSTSDRNPAASRHHGGPGSSHQRSDRPDPTEGRGPKPDEPTNPDRSQISGGGERDRHHTHNPPQKGGQG